MKNITVSIDDEVYRRARIRAAEQDTSVSGLVRDYLIQLSNGANSSWQSEFGRLAVLEQEIRDQLFATNRGLRSADNLTREELHDRDALH